MELDLATFGVFKDAAEVLLATGTILGMTALIGKALPDTLRDRVLPGIACLLGIGIALAFQMQHGEPVTIIGAMVGVVFGGSVTGLYAVAKNMKQTPQVVVQS